MSARGALTGAGSGSVWPRGPWRGFQVQKDTLFCRFEANPGSRTAALTRPVVGVPEEIQGVLSMEVGGWADLLLCSTQPHLVDRGPPGYSKPSLSVDLYQGLPDPAVPRDCRCQQATCDCSVWCDLPNGQCPTRQQMSWLGGSATPAHPAPREQARSPQGHPARLHYHRGSAVLPPWPPQPRCALPWGVQSSLQHPSPGTQAAVSCV